MRDYREEPKKNISKKRLAFSYRFGESKIRGDQTIAKKLQKAIRQEPFSVSDEDRQAKEPLFLTHLFHSYAARTHPLTVRELLDGLQTEQVVFDPFVGSGTTLVETALRGGKGIGCDISELSVLLARFKSTWIPQAMRKALEKKGEQIVAASLERVHKHIRPLQTWDQARYYEVHVYKELCGLREEIEVVKEKDIPLYQALLLIFSSVILKASKQNAESSLKLVNRNIGKGQITRWFQEKLHEVIRLHTFFEEKLLNKTNQPFVFQQDARELIHERRIKPNSINIVLTSPPYLGVYNYLDHQLRRSAWLNINTTLLMQKEIGSRRDSREQSLAQSQIRYQEDTDTWVRAIKQVLQINGIVYVIVGDSYYHDQVIDGSAPIYQAMRQEKLTFLAACSVERLYEQGNEENKKSNLWDHILCFTKTF